ncbi:hypothetical protein VOLCADRAFT_96821 [Volvox carteri f. nagariensis]|uniref:3'-5' exonuclease domain-containing protein n=1 Tax=Volvox carteri f. nagariensis TaxID=3068 RepID=D8UB54_VOLCA|nr:uncharacterized protein VOLCADRAFT_96821 [Volvox carteri f. nagariensis]EFJ43112.1 hypothetical protein VOLCADRAFT_96821 [Volvox carteri f. nagariensis]|eukprot:XP_002955911.1 hypothetical protein VOLCADRAFT_96821 [Volvox carteri f. nagariensis]
MIKNKLRKREPSLSPILLNSATPLAHLKMMLLSPESREVFSVRTEMDLEVLAMDELALRRAATNATSLISDLEQLHLLSSSWRFSPASCIGTTPAAQYTGAGLNVSNSLAVNYINGSGNLITGATSYINNGNTALTGCSANGQLRTVFSLGPDDRDAVDLHANALSQTVLNAVVAAWPGSSALARLKRRAALALAAAADGPEGPYSMLASALGDILHRHEADAVAELRHPVTKTLRVKQLLHEGSPTDALSQQSLPLTHGSLLQPGLTGQPPPGDGNGAAATITTGPGVDGVAGFLRVVKGKYDIVVVLDFSGLMRTHGHHQPGGLQVTTSGTVGTTSAAQPAPAMLLQTSLSTGGLGSRSFDLGTATAAAAPGLPSSASLPVPSARPPPMERSASDLAAAAIELGLSMTSGVGGGGGPSTAAGAGLLTASGVSVLPSAALPPSAEEGLSELALRAFPGPSAAAQLRRAIVVHLSGLPRRCQPWSHLAAFAESMQALKPASKLPKLRSFMMHPDSRGVFLDIHLPGPGVGCALAALDLAALRRAAAAGLAAAITAAWPGQAPLERIRRAAAFTLAFAVRGPAGPYTMLGSALGTAIRKRDKEAFDALAGMGKLSELLDDSATTGSNYTIGGGGGGDGDGGGTAASRESAGSGRAVSDGSTGASVAEAVSAGPGSGGASAAAAVSAGPSSAGVAAAGVVRSSSDGDGAAAGAQRSSGDGGAVAGGNGGAGAGSGYIVSFKKDQDGYMRLRLEALLLDWPKEEPSAVVAATSLATASAAASTASSEGPATAAGLQISGSGGLQVSLEAAVATADDTASVASADISSYGGNGGLAGSEAATIAAAKRCIARLLAWAPPPHQLTFAKLGAQVPKLLGGARIGRNLRLVCLEEPDVFSVQSQPHQHQQQELGQYNLSQIGIAVHGYDGRPALVSLYAPPALSISGGSAATAAAAASGGSDSGAGGGGSAASGAAATEAWPAAVYVLDCTANCTGDGPEAIGGVLLTSLRGLLEDPGVAKVVHGCEQVRPLELASGAAIAPLLDTAVLLNAIFTLLPPLPPPPPAAAVAVAAASGPLPSIGYSSAEAAAVAQLWIHVTELRAVLQSVELWADRPELLAVLGGVHFAAHRAELWAVAGRDRLWLSRPLSDGQVLVAAQSVRHLPELWSALCEAIPWLAAHAALRMMQHLRCSAATAAAAAAAAAATSGLGLRLPRQI